MLVPFHCCGKPLCNPKAEESTSTAEKELIDWENERRKRQSASAKLNGILLTKINDLKKTLKSIKDEFNSAKPSTHNSNTSKKTSDDTNSCTRYIPISEVLRKSIVVLALS
eukprot:TRINITY_DN10457_c0_g2_i1.p1 TRINITY_DN10457_c0_g2~~TRINITY_DN10457_c0_g2_i1.p1  ORF type:complete len:111 (+),score=21.79 TRINITY_DN10457_c0_g2_i1:104-436(+)